MKYSKETTIYNQDAIKNGLDESAKTASNFMSFDQTNGLVVGNMQPDETLAGNVQLTAEPAVHLRDGIDDLAKFSRDGVELYDGDSSVASFNKDGAEFGVIPYGNRGRMLILKVEDNRETKGTIDGVIQTLGGSIVGMHGEDGSLSMTIEPYEYLRIYGGNCYDAPGGYGLEIDSLKSNGYPGGAKIVLSCRENMEDAPGAPEEISEIDITADRVNGLKTGFQIIEKTIASGSISANGYSSKTINFSDRLYNTDKILAVSYIRSEDSDIVPYRWDFTGTTVNIGVRNVLNSSQSATIHVGVLVAN